jgi:hypothetical protein
MKPINFITASTPAEHREVARMLHRFILLTLIAILIMISITGYYIHYLSMIKETVRELNMHCKRFAPRLAQHAALCAQEEKLRALLHTAQTQHTKECVPLLVIQTLQEKKPATIMLQTISIDQRGSSCIIECTDARSAHTYLQTLSQTALFKSARITEIRAHGHLYRATLQLSYR